MGTFNIEEVELSPEAELLAQMMLEDLKQLAHNEALSVSLTLVINIIMTTEDKYRSDSMKAISEFFSTMSEADEIEIKEYQND